MSDDLPPMLKAFADAWKLSEDDVRAAADRAGGDVERLKVELAALRARSVDRNPPIKRVARRVTSRALGSVTRALRRRRDR